MTARPLTLDAPVCALVPHFRCEQWLDQALTSLREQTRAPDAIVVLDDASPVPPADVVAAHPGVTLLAAADNVGPYRLIQTVIEATGFAAYLFQDADDWSAPGRLETLLREAAATGAQLVGTHELRVREDSGEIVPVAYPADVNAAIRERPGSYALLHPSSLVSRELVVGIGGYATGMRFSGDVEFLQRAVHAATVRNADYEGYFRRRRPDSLTSAAATGLRSQARSAVHAALGSRTRRIAEDAAAGRPLDLRPWRTAPPARLTHLLGPALDAQRSRPGPSARPAPGPAPARHDPVFVIGAPASGQQALAAALGRHPHLEAVPDGRWVARVAAEVSAWCDDRSAPVPPGFGQVMGEALAALTRPGGRRAVVGGAPLTAAASALAALLPQARFIHVVRDVEPVVASLLDSPVEGGVFYTAETAWHAWAEAVAAGLALEHDLGGDRVLRVRYDDVASDPAAVATRCLEHLGEPRLPGCAPVLPPPPTRPPGPPPATARAQLRAVLEALDGGRADGGPKAPPGPTPPDGRVVLVDAVRDLACAATPAGATVAVVSRGDARLIDLPARAGVHCPPDPDGGYAGYHPAHGTAAVDALARTRATHLVVPATDLWWLDAYDDLRAHLAGSAALVAYREGVAAVYRLDIPRSCTAADPVRFVATPVGTPEGATA